MSRSCSGAKIFGPATALEVDPALIACVGPDSFCSHEIGALDHVVQTPISGAGSHSQIEASFEGIKPSRRNSSEISQRSWWNMDQQMRVGPSVAGILVNEDPSWQYAAARRRFRVSFCTF